MSTPKRSDQKTFLGIKANGPVFIGSLTLVSILVITTLVLGEPMKSIFSSLQSQLSKYHFNANPYTSPDASMADKADQAMSNTFLHWGFHAWGLYAVMGVALAYFTFNKKLPLSIRSLFYPLLGERIHGYLGDLIDIIAVTSNLYLDDRIWRKRHLSKPKWQYRGMDGCPI